MLIYVSGPYSAPTLARREEHVAAAIEAGRALLDNDIYPLLVHLNHLYSQHMVREGMPDLTYEDYLDWDLELLTRCDGLWQLSPSPGSDREVEAARLANLPVFYSLDALLLYRDHKGKAGERGRTTHTSERAAWSSMKHRCSNPNNKHWTDYGGRGIQVEPRWLGPAGYHNFLADMGRKPRPEYSLDRIDNDGNYGPENCRWATSIQQHGNTRAVKFITYEGETLPQNQMARLHGMSPHILKNRLKHGWKIERALTQPVQQRNTEMEAVIG